MSTSANGLPVWDMSNVYSGLDADDFKNAVSEVGRRLDKLEKAESDGGIGRLDAPPTDLDATASALAALIIEMNDTLRLMRTVGAYISSFVTTNSYDKVAAKAQSSFHQISVRFSNTYVLFEAWIGSLEPVIDELCGKNDVIKRHRQVLIDIAEESRYRMTPEMEELASELLMSGGGIMDQLQSTVTSQLKVPFELDGKTEMLPMTMLRNLSNNPDEDVRKRAYEAELAGWETIRESVAFALNGVKGTAITLAKHRGRDDVLHAALDDNKIDRETLDALLAAMRDSLPTFRRYFKSKAKKLGKNALPWWDLFAPVGSIELSYTWNEARDYIVEQFGTFSPEMAEYAAHAFEHGWIDAEPRDGKVGGAFCMRVPGVDESRI
ncbi:oligoendopeptidase F, partial [bacterium]|nr:oligoendopeptidase F [bacterium]